MSYIRYTPTGIPLNKNGAIDYGSREAKRAGIVQPNRTKMYSNYTPPKKKRK